MAGKGNRFKEPQEVDTDILDEVEDAKPEKKVRQKKEKVTPGASKNKSESAFVGALKDERTHKISGLFLILISVFLLIAFISYFVTWKNDQSLVSGSWFDLMRSNGT